MLYNFRVAQLVTNWQSKEVTTKSWIQYPGNVCLYIRARFDEASANQVNVNKTDRHLFYIINTTLSHNTYQSEGVDLFGRFLVSHTFSALESAES